MEREKEAKFRCVYAEYNVLIYALIVKRVRDHHIAQDISQDTFFKLYMNMDELCTEVIRGWLIVTACNATKDYERKRKREIMFSPREMERLDRNTDSSGFFGDSRKNGDFTEELHQREFIQRMMEEVQEANRNWYDLITLTGCCERSQEEVAEFMGISRNALRSKLNRARNWLRIRYGEEYGKL